MEEDEQTRAEAEAQVDEGSAGEFALAWLHTVVVLQRWDLAMQTATVAFRIRSASRWLEANGSAPGMLHTEDRDDAHSAFVALGSAHPLWSAYANACIREYTDLFGCAAEHMAIGGRPRPISVDREEILVVDYRTVPGIDDNGIKILDAPMDPLLRLVVRHTDSGFLMDASYSPLPG